MIPGLSISIVTCGIDKKLLTTVLDNVQQSVTQARQQQVLDVVQLHIIDNGHEEALLRRIVGSLDLAVTTTINNTNIGFGRAHNMAINASIAEYHLILNPDAITDVNALTQGIRYLTANPDVELVAPAVLTPSGEQHHLCRRYPSLFNLFLRGFMPRSFTTMFNNRLAHYEYRELSQTNQVGKSPWRAAALCCAGPVHCNASMDSRRSTFCILRIMTCRYGLGKSLICLQ